MLRHIFLSFVIAIAPLSAHALSAAQKAATSGGPFDCYVDSINGNDSFNCQTPSTAKKTLAAVSQRVGLRIGLAANSIFRESWTITADGISSAPYGSGTAPSIFNSTQFSSGWSNIVGDVWQRTLGYTAVNAFVVSANYSSVTKLILGTFGTITAGQFAVSGSFLQVNIGSGIDPNTVLIEVPKNSAVPSINITANNFSVTGTRVWFAADNAILINATNNITIANSDIRYAASDGVGVHAAGGGTTPATNVIVKNNIIKRNGKTRTLSGGDGDGVSFHETCTGSILFNDIEDNEKSGVSNQQRTTVTIYGNYFRNNNQEYVLLNEGSTGGTQYFYYNVVVWPAADAATDAIEFLQGTVTGPPTAYVYNNTIYAESKTGSPRGVRNVDAIVVMRNNIIDGFDRGIDYRGTVTNPGSSLDNDYDDMFNNTTNYFNNGQGTGVQPGAHDITTDPQFVSAGTNFNLQSGSGARSSGVGVGLTYDIVRNPVPAVSPDMGAYQHQ